MRCAVPNGLHSRLHQRLNVFVAPVGGEKRRKPYFRFDARAAFDVAMVTG